MFFISLTFGIFIILLTSKIIFKEVSYFYFIITLFLIASPIQLIAYTQAWLIKYYFILVVILNIFSFILIYARKELFILSNLVLKIKKINIFLLLFQIYKKINFKEIIIPLLLTIILTYKLLPNYWRFEAHDVLYYSWMNDIFNIDYPGGIRVPTAYPFALSANHLIPSSILIPFCFFITLVSILD